MFSHNHWLGEPVWRQRKLISKARRPHGECLSSSLSCCSKTPPPTSSHTEVFACHCYCFLRVTGGRFGALKVGMM